MLTTSTDPVERARAAAASGLSQYVLGGGGYHPQHDPAGALVDDSPYGPRSSDGAVGVDCSAFAIQWAHMLPGHRPGFNRGPWSTVSDDINTDSALEDSWHLSELFRLVNGWVGGGDGSHVARNQVQPGDLLIYRSIYDDHGKRLWPWIGHVSIVLDVDAAFDPTRPRWELLRVAQAKGPDYRHPAVIVTDGSIWTHHDELWQATDADRRDRPERGAAVIRVRPGTAK